MHGGGFVYRGAKNHYSLCFKIAERCMCTVVYVDYRLAYNNKYPTTINDAFSSYDYILKNMAKKKVILYCELNDIEIDPNLKKKYIEKW